MGLNSNRGLVMKRINIDNCNKLLEQAVRNNKKVYKNIDDMDLGWDPENDYSEIPMLAMVTMDVEGAKHDNMPAIADKTAGFVNSLGKAFVRDISAPGDMVPFNILDKAACYCGNNTVQVKIQIASLATDRDILSRIILNPHNMQNNILGTKSAVCDSKGHAARNAEEYRIGKSIPGWTAVLHDMDNRKNKDLRMQ